MTRFSGFKYALFSGLLLLAIVNLTRTSIQILQTSKKIENMDAEVTALEQEKRELEASIEYKKSDAYVEEKARNELNLVKPKEELFFVPGFEKNHVSSGDLARAKVLGISDGSPRLTYAEREENVKRWFELFF